VDGAVIEDVTISNIAMRGIIGAPIFVRLGSRMRGPAGAAVGLIRRLNISNIVCSETDSQACSLIVGVPGHAIEDVKIHNVVVAHPGGGTAKDAAIRLTEKEKDYPEPTMFGETPAHAFFIRHATGVEMNGIKVKSEKADARPAFYLEDVHDASFFQTKLPADSARPVFVLKNVSDVSIWSSGPVGDVVLDRADDKEL
jgi:polygalacturonase